jgi:hypothetical protein
MFPKRYRAINTTNAMGVVDSLKIISDDITMACNTSMNYLDIRSLFMI